MNQSINQSINLLFYTTCIRPVLQYARPVFHHSLPQYLSNEMERLQKRALRIIQPDLSYAEALVALDITSLYERRKALSWGGGGKATFHTFLQMKSKRCSHNLQGDQQEACQRICVLITRITSKTIDQPVLRENGNMAVEGGTVSQYYILVIRKFIDFMSLFIHSVWFSFSVKQFPFAVFGICNI